MHVDNVYVPMDKADEAICSLVQHGYDEYNGAVKEDWERDGGRPNPDLSFRVVEHPSKTVAERIAEASARSMETSARDGMVMDEYVK